MGKDDLRPFSRMQISAHNSLCKRPETTTYERVMRAAVIHTCPPTSICFLEIPLAKSKKLVYAISLPPPPTGTEQSVLTRAYTLHLPLGSLPLSPLKYVNVAKRALRALKWWPTRSMTWTTTWQSSADCRSGQLPVIYDSKPSSSPIKIKDSAFPQQSDSTGPICQVRLSWQKRAAENHVTRQKSRFFFSSL